MRIQETNIPICPTQITSQSELDVGGIGERPSHRESMIDAHPGQGKTLQRSERESCSEQECVKFGEMSNEIRLER